MTKLKRTPLPTVPSVCSSASSRPRDSCILQARAARVRCVSKPAALVKAESLLRHLHPLQEQAAVTLSDREAWEFLDWFRPQVDRTRIAEFDRDLAQAKASSDPWPMLKGTYVLGFGLERLENEVH